MSSITRGKDTTKSKRKKSLKSAEFDIYHNPGNDNHIERDYEIMNTMKSSCCNKLMKLKKGRIVCSKCGLTRKETENINKHLAMITPKARSKDICNICQKPIKPTPKPLPEKHSDNFLRCSTNESFMLGCVMQKQNDLIDYLSNNKGER